LEQQLDGGLHLRLGGRGMDLEHDLAVPVGEQRRLLGDLRREQHLHQTLLAESTHCQTSSILASARLVTSTLAKLTTETGSVSETSSTSTLCSLRDDRNRFSSNGSVMTSTESRPMPFSFCDSSFVFGASTCRSSITARRSSRASCDRMVATPARYILRLTFCVKFSSGVFGNTLPPPRQIGLDDIPARARPVPF